MLIEKGAELETDETDAAIKRGRVEIVELLRSKGAPLRTEEYNALHTAVSYAQPDVVRYLLRHGFDPKRSRINGESELHNVGDLLAYYDPTDVQESQSGGPGGGNA